MQQQLKRKGKTAQNIELHRQQHNLLPRAKSVDFALTQSESLNIILSHLFDYLQIIGTQSKMYSLWFIHPSHLHTWPDAFCSHPDTEALSQGIGCPRDALSLNWSGPDSSLVHPHWKPQMRWSTNAFIFIRGALDKVSGSFCAAEMVTGKALKPDVFRLYL